LDWLLNDWTQPTVRARDIHRLGPNSIRDRQQVSDLTDLLVKRGWLTRNPTRRRDMREWRIVQKAIIDPRVNG
jgi:hypothetical protein